MSTRWCEQVSFSDLAQAFYLWLDANAVVVFGLCAGIPAAAVVLCAVTRRAQRRGSGGHWLANVTLWSSLGLLVLELVCIAIARAIFDVALADAPVLLLAGPPVGAVVAVIGIHWVYPLNQLAAWRTLTDIGWFVLACGVVIWLVSQFRGWGILFGGSLLELIAIAAFVVWLLRRLYRRAFK